jgi:hypothetical protein
MVPCHRRTVEIERREIMGRKNANGMPCRRVYGLRSGASLVAVLSGICLFSASAAVAEQVAADPCDSALISEEQAKGTASSLMQELGWDRSGSFRSSAMGTRFRIGEANCVSGQWRVSVTLSRGKAPSMAAVVLINCHSGEIEETLRSS